MKRLSTFVFALLLAGSLSFAQDTGGDKAADSGKKVQKTTKTKKAHKGGKKSKKSSGTTTPPPK